MAYSHHNAPKEHIINKKLHMNETVNLRVMTSTKKTLDELAKKEGRKIIKELDIIVQFYAEVINKSEKK